MTALGQAALSTNVLLSEPTNLLQLLLGHIYVFLGKAGMKRIILNRLRMNDEYTASSQGMITAQTWALSLYTDRLLAEAELLKTLQTQPTVKMKSVSLTLFF